MAVKQTDLAEYINSYNRNVIVCPVCEHYIAAFNPSKFFCHTCGYLQVPPEEDKEETYVDVFSDYLNCTPSKIEELIDEYRGIIETVSINEIKYTKYICEQLDKIGFEYESPKSCPAGRMDIYLLPTEQDCRPKILEVKMHNGGQDMKTALGQLPSYSLEEDDALLYIHCPEGIPPIYRRIFRKYTIDVFQF